VRRVLDSGLATSLSPRSLTLRAGIIGWTHDGVARTAAL
jgi:hypothetical protein